LQLLIFVLVFLKLFSSPLLLLEERHSVDPSQEARPLVSPFLQVNVTRLIFLFQVRVKAFSMLKLIPFPFLIRHYLQQQVFLPFRREFSEAHFSCSLRPEASSLSPQ
jgi:hypothetical protein